MFDFICQFRPYSSRGVWGVLILLQLSLMDCTNQDFDWNLQSFSRLGYRTCYIYDTSRTNVTNHSGPNSFLQYYRANMKRLWHATFMYIRKQNYNLFRHKSLLTSRFTDSIKSNALFINDSEHVFIEFINCIPSKNLWTNLNKFQLKGTVLVSTRKKI